MKTLMIVHLALATALVLAETSGETTTVREEQQQEVMVKVFSLQRGLWGAPADDVFLRYNFSKDAQPVHLLSACYRIRFESFSKSFDVHISYKATNDNFDPFYFGNSERYFDTWFKNKEQSGLPPWDVFPEKWHHVCHVFGPDTYTLYWEG
ncbi:putative Gamma-aminobutyric acid receptor subunit beta-like 13, partial [Homarus americanus]